MIRQAYFITHPNVQISAEVPVPRWPLSPRGVARMQHALQQPWVPGISAVYCSSEQKAIDGAQILADHRQLTFQPIHDLGENDRSSTGFLPPPEFEAMANRFFANPDVSVQGWERAVDAQRRVVAAVQALLAADTSTGAIAIVSHGAVGTLLYCHLAGLPISRQWDQPPNSGGNYFHFTMDLPNGAQTVSHAWKPIDDAA
jgi:broad specificity phosphatase PhoE